MKTVLILIIAVIFCLTAAPTKASASGEELILEVGRDLVNLFGGIIFNSSDSKSPKKENTAAKENQVAIQKIQESIIKNEVKQGHVSVFGSFHEIIQVNEKIVLVSYEGTRDNKSIILSLLFMADAQPDEFSFKRYLVWDSMAEYKQYTFSKEALIDILSKLFPALIQKNLASVSAPQLQPQAPAETATATTPAQPQPVPQSTPTATATPETAPANTASPAPSTALSNNP